MPRLAITAWPLDRASDRTTTWSEVDAVRGVKGGCPDGWDDAGSMFERSFRAQLSNLTGSYSSPLGFVLRAFEVTTPRHAVLEKRRLALGRHRGVIALGQRARADGPLRQELMARAHRSRCHALCRGFEWLRCTAWYRPTKAAPEVSPELADPIEAQAFARLFRRWLACAETPRSLRQYGRVCAAWRQQKAETPRKAWGSGGEARKRSAYFTSRRSMSGPRCAAKNAARSAMFWSSRPATNPAMMALLRSPDL